MFNIAVNIPMLLGEADYRYTSCNSTFECGSITNVTYPFWGGKRPSHCGYPDFKLECLEGGDVTIDFNSRFRVLDINQENQTLRLARRDISGNLCSLQPVNTSLNFDKVRYTPYSVNLTICYGCPSMFYSLLSCKINNTDELFTSVHPPIWSGLEQNQINNTDELFTSC
ncbi:LEAF RUST 10 DISEASE-RESISTANCE LOCUS RECEPTOR-LIKE PROTEIN KINASE-like 2.1 [Thalictrum thalictroides]|uniref:LEAF RUST 10 DISEASE-RESISTANCE LOCUS RECEPTOR-LIKE PROTEIN KINASE-like 2.1 n=1 Tax=Thalictrum thalictroides TaxID=46969 RepID=A0A7J6WVR1_THATH|nr:LEAF RUST 10 DISEASE-RESISTANCE LOCUS RECEPTOR-LIKE PROTEIN KINASE-like 2.1 [Thalictrum thalictroides]